MLQHRSASSSRLSLDFPDLPGKPAYTLKPGQPSPGQHSLLRPPFAVTPSTGILTCFPSTTPFGLALGPDLPWADEPSPGILRLSAKRILTSFIVYLYRHSLFHWVHERLRSRFVLNGSLLYQCYAFRVFGVVFEPRYIFGAEPLDQ